MDQKYLHPPDALGLILLGGAAGASIRWGFIELFAMGEPFWALLVLNGLGCFLVGWLRATGPDRGPDPTPLVSGFCGGLTTFSTVTVESAVLIDHGRAGVMAVYLTGSLLTGVLLVLLGRRLGTALS
jgi:CrcB protein